MMHRRSFLGTAAALLTAGCGRAVAPSPELPGAAEEAFAAIERRVGGRVGVYAMDAATGVHCGHRADERFAMCSTFKWALAAAVLGRIDRGELALDQPIAYGQADLLEYAPVTREHVAAGRMTVEALAQAAVTVSDNTAANLLLARIGGPKGMTRFFRELGDAVTRLDRNEPMLNANDPGDARDTTSPRAMAGALHTVLAGGILAAASRDRLMSWLVASQMGRSRLRAGFPRVYRAGDKTGAGNNGACNDVAVVWPPSGGLWTVAAYLSGGSATVEQLTAAHTEIARAVTAKLG